MNKIEKGIDEFITLRKDFIYSINPESKKSYSRLSGYKSVLRTFKKILDEDKKFNRDEEGSYKQLFEIVCKREIHSLLEHIIALEKEGYIYWDLGAAAAWIDIEQELRKIYMNLKFGYNPDQESETAKTRREIKKELKNDNKM